jgi:peptidylprolyl isomerase
MKLFRSIFAVAVVVSGAATLVSITGCTKCSKSSDSANNQSGQTPADAVGGSQVNAGQSADQAGGQLEIVEITSGNGAEAVDGKRVTVHYTGTLENGTKFDSSVDRNVPFTFTLGQGQVIAGWDQGVKGMKVGGKRKLVIPPQLGYGEKGVGGVIPPNAKLLFEVELLKVE